VNKTRNNSITNKLNCQQNIYPVATRQPNYGSKPHQLHINNAQINLIESSIQQRLK
jgi:hypothetical protein